MTVLYYNCLTCDKQTKAVKGKSNKFCSIDCYRVMQRSGAYKKGSSRIHKCTNCGNTVVGVSKNKKRDGSQCDYIFCNRDCYDIYRSKIKAEIKGVCLNCNTEITKTMTSNRNPKYCGNICKLEHKKSKDRHCVSCGVWFSSLKWNSSAGRLVADNNRKTCSYQCQIQHIKTNQGRKEKISKAFSGANHPNWQGGSSYLDNRGFRGSNWKLIRSKVIERDNFKCLHCGMGQDEHKKKYGCDFNVNHKIPFYQFGGKTELANRLNNLETLCKSCHTKADWKYRKENQIQQILHF